VYRDFYRDIGFDLPEKELMGEVGADGARLMTGLKYFRITGKSGPKEPYDPARAAERVREHAAHFARERAAQLARLAAGTPQPPIVVAPYDAELFGHWWFEGPLFLEAVFRELWAAPHGPRPVALGQFLEAHPICVEATPSASSWGAGGYGDVWVGEEAAWTWRHVHHATRYVRHLVQRHRHEGGARGDALDQMIRELLLLQSSDWAFILKMKTSTGYAQSRLRAHSQRLRHLGYLVEKEKIEGDDATWLDDIRQRDNFLWQMTGQELRDVWDG
jgi:1,4-alpha-glucan branching enzyme